MEGALRLPNPLCRLPNACYLNAALQILTSMPNLVETSTSLGEHFAELSRLTKIKRSKDIADVVDPKTVLKWLNTVLPEHLKPKGRQGDAHEVLIGILTRLEESSRQAQKRVQNLVYGGFINDTICAKCKVRSRKDEPFMQLCITLPERPRPLTTLQDYFTQLSAPEKLSAKTSTCAASVGRCNRISKFTWASIPSTSLSRCCASLATVLQSGATGLQSLRTGAGCNIRRRTTSLWHLWSIGVMSGAGTTWRTASGGNMTLRGNPNMRGGALMTTRAPRSTRTILPQRRWNGMST